MSKTQKIYEYRTVWPDGYWSIGWTPDFDGMVARASRAYARKPAAAPMPLYELTGRVDVSEVSSL